jgi:hypothetical protein
MKALVPSSGRVAASPGGASAWGGRWLASQLVRSRRDDRFASIADRAQETCEREAIDAGSSFNGPCIAVAAIALETEGSAHNAAAPPRVVMSIEMQRLTLTC